MASFLSPSTSEETSKPRVMVSTTWALPLGDAAHSRGEVVFSPRRSDWGLSGVRAKVFHVREGVRTAWGARGFDALVLCNAGIETVVCGLASLLFSPRQRRVAVDFLVPTSERHDWILGLLLRPWHFFGCIRSNDRRVLTRRFGVSRTRSGFVPFPLLSDGGQLPSTLSEDGYVYAAGVVHRDWPTFFAAMEQIDARVICGVGCRPVPPVPSRLRARMVLRGPDSYISPSEGREYAARASVVVIPMLETDLPAGPLVLLDAMALGKAIVATSTSGVIDYARDGEDCLLVEAGDTQGMALAVRRLLNDEDLRHRLGSQARSRAMGLTLDRLLDEVLALAL